MFTSLNTGTARDKGPDMESFRAAVLQKEVVDSKMVSFSLTVNISTNS